MNELYLERLVRVARNCGLSEAKRTAEQIRSAVEAEPALRDLLVQLDEKVNVLRLEAQRARGLEASRSLVPVEKRPPADRTPLKGLIHGRFLEPLEARGVLVLEDCLFRTVAELLRMPAIGTKAVEEIEAALQTRHGMRIGQFKQD